MLEIMVMEISPALAAQWLKGNKGNRPISKATVSAYAEDMKNGAWALNGETIKISFDANGEPITVDGQHRLYAIVQSGVTIQSCVVFSADDPRFIDNGRARSFRDSATLGDTFLEYAWMRSNIIVAICRYAIKQNPDHKGSKVTNAQTYQYMLENSEALEFVYSMQNRTARNMKGLQKATVWAAVKAAYDSGYDRDNLVEFCKVFTSGEGISKYHTPIIKFRNWCITNSHLFGSKCQDTSYKRAQYALRAFEMKNAVAMTKEAKTDFYKLK